MKRMIILIAVCSAFLTGGCGYHLAGSIETPSRISGKTIAIPMWRSKIYRPYLESVLTGSLVDEFALRNGGMVVDEDAADLVLSGTIVSYTTVGVSYTAADQVREYRATMTVNSTLTDRRSRKVLWKGTISSSQDYPASIDVTAPNRIALQQNSEEAALKEISRKLAQQLYQKVTEDF